MSTAPPLLALLPPLLPALPLLLPALPPPPGTPPPEPVTTTVSTCAVTVGEPDSPPTPAVPQNCWGAIGVLHDHPNWYVPVGTFKKVESYEAFGAISHSGFIAWDACHPSAPASVPVHWIHCALPLTTCTPTELPAATGAGTDTSADVAHAGEAKAKATSGTEAAEVNAAEMALFTESPLSAATRTRPRRPGCDAVGAPRTSRMDQYQSITCSDSLFRGDL